MSAMPTGEEHQAIFARSTDKAFRKPYVKSNPILFIKIFPAFVFPYFNEALVALRNWPITSISSAPGEFRIIVNPTENSSTTKGHPHRPQVHIEASVGARTALRWIGIYNARASHNRLWCEGEKKNKRGDWSNARSARNDSRASLARSVYLCTWPGRTCAIESEERKFSFAPRAGI